MSRRKEKRKGGAVAAVVAIILVASVFILLKPAPEQVFVTSSDGLLRASGSTSSGVAFASERLDNVQTGIQEPVSPVYELSLTGGAELKNGEVIVVINDDSISLSQVVIYIFDRATLLWIPLPTIFDLSNSTVSSSLSFTGSLLVGAGLRVQSK